MPLVSQKEFAELKGVSAEAVRQAIQGGRLKNCLHFDGIHKKAKLDPVVAAEEWERNTDHSKRYRGRDIRVPLPRAEPYTKPNVNRPDEPPAPNAPTANQSRAILEAYRARLAKLEYEEKSGKLVDAEKVKAEAYKLARTVRDSMFNIPDRVAAEFAGISTAAEIHMRLTDEIRKALESLIVNAVD